ncbi:MAG: molybdopterin converting factor subunit 1 [Planctomycetota bacterium]
MQVSVRCFASVRELLGADALTVELAAGATVRDLKARLCEQAPDLDRLQVACAVNRSYAAPETVLADGDEVAFIPPISGGDAEAGAQLFRFDLSTEPLEARPLEREVRTDADGAVVTFAGVTRNHNDGRAVRGLSYEAYGEMAARLMVEVFQEALQRFAFTRARVAHRVGPVPMGEASVLVVVSAPHRAPAFDACRFIMDRVKAELPIFKKEDFADGDGPEGSGGSRWVGDLPTGQPRV